MKNSSNLTPQQMSETLNDMLERISDLELLVTRIRLCKYCRKGGNPILESFPGQYYPPPGYYHQQEGGKCLASDAIMDSEKLKLLGEPS